MFKLNNKIKLVIWDLDETFWKGTLSEEGIDFVEKNKEVVVELSNIERSGGEYRPEGKVYLVSTGKQVK